MNAREEDVRLVGWKAIGQFLHCTERTARRWEVDRALPVRRVPGGNRSSVWASSVELTLWLQALPSEARTERREDEAIDLDASASTAIAPRELEPVAAEIADAPAVPPRDRRFRPIAAIVLVTLALGGVAIWTFSTRYSHPGAAEPHTPYDDNRAARELFMTAGFELSTRTADSLTAAERDFRRVVDMYPERAAGWSGLANTYLLLREFGSMGDDVAYPRAAQAARTAIGLDPKLADAWLDQGFVAFWWQGNPTAAFHDFETALQLDPTSAKAFHWYATALIAHGDFAKSLQMIARAHALDPGSRAIVADEGWLRFLAGQRTEGLATLERLVRIDPQFVSWHSYLARAYLVQARDADFLREAIATAELRGQPDTVTRLRLAERQFQIGGHRAMLDQLTASEIEDWHRGTGSAVVIAGYRALANDDAGLFTWLAAAEARHDHNLPRLHADPEFANYRDDPRFIAYIRLLP